MRLSTMMLITRPDSHRVLACWAALVVLAGALLTPARHIRAEDGEPRATGAASGLFAAQPTISPNPNSRAPLIAVIDVQANAEVTATLELDDGERQWEQEWPVEPARSLRVAAVGMRPDREHTIRVRITDPVDGDCEVSDAMTFHTPALPRDFPPLETRISQPEKMEPGVTLFPVTVWLDDKRTMNYGYLVAVDAEGEVVWYLETGHRMADVDLLSNGHLLYLHANFENALEVDLLGNVIHQWHCSHFTRAPNPKSIPVYLDTMHHELIELPDGAIAALSTELRQFDHFPTSASDPEAPWEPASVVCDELVVFRPEDGWILRRYPLADLLDPTHFGYLSLSDFWKGHYGRRVSGAPRDWSHANGAIYDDDDDTFIVSFRHLDCLVKIDRATGKLIWILGDPRHWAEPWQKYLLKPDGPMEWPYHQHAPRLTPAGTILLYDNGNYRAQPYEPPTLAADNHSRVVEFEVDEASWCVRQLWEYEGTPNNSFFSPFYCEGEWMPETGNVLVTDGGRIELKDGTPHGLIPGEHQWARIIEITRTDPPETVFELTCDTGAQSRMGWSVYRSIRLRDLADLRLETDLLRRRESGERDDNAVADNGENAGPRPARRPRRVGAAPATGRPPSTNKAPAVNIQRRTDAGDDRP